MVVRGNAVLTRCPLEPGRQVAPVLASSQEDGIDAGSLRMPGSEIDLRRTIAGLVSNATRAAGPDRRAVVEPRGVGGHALSTVGDIRPGSGQIRRGIGLGPRAAAGSLKTHGGRIEYSLSRVRGTLAALVLPALYG